MYDNEKLDLRIKYTREWTFEALYKLLEHKEYNDIKISEIIDKAGISRATFYRNFNNKDDIVKHKVHLFYNSFFRDTEKYYHKNSPLDETALVVAFFKKIDEEEKVIDTVIKTNLEYLMIEGVSAVINYYKDHFYNLVKTKKKTEDYTMDIVSSSVWTLLSRWHKTGKQESARELAKIYLSAFKSVYIALFDDRSKL